MSNAACLGGSHCTGSHESQSVGGSAADHSGAAEVVHINLVMADATLLAMREAQSCCEMPYQDDEVQTWFNEAHGVATIAKASGDGEGNAVVDCLVMEVPCFGSHCETQPPSSILAVG